MQHKILIFTATYNEAECVSPFINAILQSNPTSDLLVVDDNSPDGTGILLEELKKQHSRLYAIHRPRKMGVGSAHKLGMLYALENGYDYIITMDADFSHNPDDIKRFLNNLEQYDFVIGSRYIKGGHCNYKNGRKLLSLTANFLGRLLLGVPSKELTTSYRGFKTEKLDINNIRNIKSDNYGFFIELCFLLYRSGVLIKEIPIRFNDRRAGSTKITTSAIIYAAINLVRLFFLKYTKYPDSPTKDHNNVSDNQTCNICGSSFFTTIFPSRGIKDLGPDVFNCTTAYHNHHGRIVDCLQCGVRYTNPIPSNISVYYSQVKDELYIRNIDSRIKTFEYNFNKIEKYIEQDFQILDIGSYCGVFLKILKDKGFNATGIEPSVWASDFARINFNVSVFTGTFDEFSSENKKFDLVTCWDVLEHIENPSRAVAKINHLLKTGGHFAFSTLDIDNFMAKILGEKWPWYLDMHLYYFNTRTVEHMLKLNGFKIISIQNYCHFVSSEYLLLKLRKIGIPFLPPLIQFLDKSSKNKQTFIPFKFGDIKLYHCVKVSEIDCKYNQLPT